MKSYSVKQLADLAGVSTRTLHYYDEIGLLCPALIRENGYRQYEETEVLRLQQILFYRKLGLNLKAIKAILDRADFDAIQALQLHRSALQEQLKQLQSLIQTIDNTITYLRGERQMSKNELFTGFSEAQQEEYAQQARELYDPELVDESMKRWKRYSDEKKASIMAEGEAITLRILNQMDKGYDNPEVQEQIAAWHAHIGNFYQCSLEIFSGLGQMYEENPEFAALYARMHPEMPSFFNKAIQEYVRRQRA